LRDGGDQGAREEAGLPEALHALRAMDELEGQAAEDQAKDHGDDQRGLCRTNGLRGVIS
jgi:hypothetical protein